jgi:distribution and morphology protein 12
LKLIIAVDLALNYPSPFFVTLPLELTLTELHIETAAAIAYMAPRSEVESEEAVRKVHFCLVEEEDEQDASTTNRANGYKEVDDNAKMNPLRGFHIESKIGNASCEQEDAADAVKDVEKVEKLMLKLIRELLEKEICFPSYYTFIL